MYYRLNTFPIYMPALRERREDIPLLASALLQAQDYPGNVRELRNLLERASLLPDGSALDATNMQEALQSGSRALKAMEQAATSTSGGQPHGQSG